MIDKFTIFVVSAILVSILIPVGQAVKNNAENYIQYVENVENNLGV